MKRLHGQNSLLCEGTTRTAVKNDIVLFIHQPVGIKKRQKISLGNVCCLGHFAFQTCDSVVFLAGVELIFFIISGMDLCFGFLIKTLMIIQRCFCYFEQGLDRVKAFSASHSPQTSQGVPKDLGEGTAGTADHTDHRDIP